MYKYKTIDLCSGIGGIRRGFEMTGRFENVLSAEIDDFACNTYEFLFGENPKNDITSEDFKKMVCNIDYDVLLAGFPCQSFSAVGLQLGFQDTTRGTLFFDIADIISRTKPKALFLENVENLIAHDKGQTLHHIVETLEKELNYKIIGVQTNSDDDFIYSRKSLVRNTRDFGLPQNRPRVYILAFNRSVYGEALKTLPSELPTHNNKLIYIDLNDGILESDVDDIYYLSEGYWETLKKHRIRERDKNHGFGFVIVNSSTIDHPIANTILATGGSGKERNLVYQPKEGVPGKKLPTKKTPLNSEGIRVMTPTEWGRLQGFIGYAFLDKNGHDNFGFPPGTTREQMYKQLGNSVSIPLVETMAEFMSSCFDLMNRFQIETVVKLAYNKTFFTKNDVMQELKITSGRAYFVLKKAIKSGFIIMTNRGRYAKYCLNKGLLIR